MLEEIKLYLASVNQGVIFDIRNALQRKGLTASGRSARTLQSEVRENEQQGRIISTVTGEGYFRQLTFGRRPTRKSQGGVLLKAIKQWVIDKGLTLNPYAVTKKIHKQGITVPNRFNDGKVISDTVNNELFTEVNKKIVSLYKSQIIQAVSQVLKR